MTWPSWTAPAYTPGVSWEDLPSRHTPENAANLNLAESSPAMYAATAAQSVYSSITGQLPDPALIAAATWFPQTFGAIDDCITITDATIASTTGAAVVASAQHLFSSADIGKKMDVRGPGAAPMNLLSDTIQSVSSGNAVLSLTATSTVSGATAWFGTDNTTALQNALNAAATARAELVIPYGWSAASTGVYLTQGLTYSSHLHMRGTGGTFQKWGGAGGVAIIGPASPSSISTVTDISITGVGFAGEGNNGSGAIGQRIGVLIYDGTQIRVAGCTFKNFPYAAVQLLGGSNCWIVDNYITNCCAPGQHNAIDLESHGVADQNPAKIVVRGNYVDLCATSAICVSIEVLSLNQPLLIQITDNDVSSSAFATIALECGATSGASTGTQQHRVIIANNFAEQTATAGSGAYAIAVTDNNAGTKSNDALQFEHIAVTGNVVNSTDGGINVQTSHSIVTGNMVDAVSSGILWAGNGVNTPVNTLIASNQVHLAINGGHGIQCAGNRGNVTSNRVAYDTGSSSATGNGIYVPGSFATVNGNTIEYAPGHGIYFNGCSDFSCLSNRVRNPSDGGSSVANGIQCNGVSTQAGISANLISANVVIDDRATNLMSRCFNNATGSAVALMNNEGYGNLFASAFSGSYRIVRGNLFTNFNGLAVATITPGASPYTYTNGDAFPEQVSVSGGTVSVVTISRAGTTVATGQTQGVWKLEQNDSLIVTYSVAPTMQKIPLTG